MTGRLEGAGGTREFAGVLAVACFELVEAPRVRLKTRRAREAFTERHGVVWGSRFDQT